MEVSAIVFLGFVGVSLVWDAATWKLPNWLCSAGMVLAVAVRMADGGASGAALALAGAGSGFVLALLLRLPGAIGSGDVKWFAAAGAFVGPLAAAQLLLYSVGIAALYAAFLIPFSRSFRIRVYAAGLQWLGWAKELAGCSLPRTRMSARSGTARFPFMLAVAPAVCLLLTGPATLAGTWGAFG